MDCYHFNGNCVDQLVFHKCIFVFYSEDELADIKNSLLFFDIILRHFRRHDEDFLAFIIQLILFILSKKSFSQDALNQVDSILVTLIAKTCYKMLYTETVGDKNQLQNEIQVCKYYIYECIYCYYTS